ncbi:MAG: hypothetical protein J07HX64_02586 [halophilic archaeon J07HX64]|nr:MAG: hypothetical protein J07HX64_02586 [halophilic archaeon J07HX64]
MLVGTLSGYVTNSPAEFTGLCIVTVLCVFLGRDHRR